MGKSHPGKPAAHPPDRDSTQPSDGIDLFHRLSGEQKASAGTLHRRPCRDDRRIKLLRALRGSSHLALRPQIPRGDGHSGGRPGRSPRHAQPGKDCQQDPALVPRQSHRIGRDCPVKPQELVPKPFRYILAVIATVLTATAVANAQS